MLYIQTVMTAEKDAKLGHDQVMRLAFSFVLFCRRFVDIQQSFSWKFCIKDGNDFSKFGRTEVNETQGYAIICRRQIARPLTRIAQSVVFKIIL